ncbi:heterokaryon incompatibility protein-domain-containing protein [Xylariaceae sp. FL1651]|nr:heterokaryon incompatibility protein-domain-containing protein [Xylariaceae sp. FL1651]
MSNEACRAITPLRYHPVEQTGSSESMNHLKSWIRACDETHTCFPGDEPILPTRVVSVTGNSVKVVHTAGKRGRYMTLSHRWGRHETFVLKASNIEEMADNIAWESIPKLYQDSIEVARCLGIQYIWIDTLCIVQDDAEDWRRESVQMKSVYGNSYLSIAAVQAVDSYGELFASSDLPAKLPSHTPYMTHLHFGSNYSRTSNPTLLRRGWVLQERILAPRVIYFDAEELKWECQTERDCQCGSMLTIRNFKTDHVGSLIRDEAPLPFQWMRVAEQYSGLQLTFDSDRLVALAGIAEQGIKSGKGGRYLAGLWERHLEHQICWEILDTHRKPETPLVPSWSWLSVFGSVRYNNRMDFSARGSEIDVEITEVDCSSTGTDYLAAGRPVSGFIRLNGRGTRMLAELTDAGDEFTPPTYCLRTGRGDEDETELWVEMDYIMTPEDASAIKEVFLLFWGEILEETTFLILKPAAENSQKYERFGIASYSNTDPELVAYRGEIISWCERKKDIIFI